MEVSGQLHPPGRFIPKEGTRGTLLGHLAAPKTCLGDVKKKISFSVAIPTELIVSSHNLGIVNEFPVHGSKMAYGVV
jgi:hypothetical protein